MKILLLLTVLTSFTIGIKAQSWSEVTKTAASDRAAGDVYGFSVSISGNYAIVSARTVGGAGAAYLIERDGSGNWNEVQKIVASDIASDDEYGNSSAISGDYAFVGARTEDEDPAGGNTMPNSGSVYVYERDGAGSWNQVQKIVATDRIADARFGGSVSVSNQYAIVGAPGEKRDTAGANSLVGAGAAYLFERDGGGNWNQVQKLVASDREFNDEFGSAVSISGDYAIVGAFFEQSGTGAAYLFERDGSGNWTEVQNIVAADRDIGDFFGASVSISGDIAIVGAYLDHDSVSGGNPLNRAGSAYFFERDGFGVWNEAQKIVASERGNDDEFGWSVSIDGNYAAIGAIFEDEDANEANSNTSTGSAYVFERDTNGNWAQVDKIVASDRTSADEFGWSVSLSGNKVVIGAWKDDVDATGGDTLSQAGSAYFFERSAGIGINPIDNNFDSELIIYPNPTPGWLTVDLGEVYQRVSLTISTLTGQFISKKHFGNTQNLTIKLDGPAAFYLVEIQTAEGKSATLKVLKE